MVYRGLLRWTAQRSELMQLLLTICLALIITHRIHLGFGGL